MDNVTNQFQTQLQPWKLSLFVKGWEEIWPVFTVIGKTILFFPCEYLKINSNLCVFCMYCLPKDKMAESCCCYKNNFFNFNPQLTSSTHLSACQNLCVQKYHNLLAFSGQGRMKWHGLAWMIGHRRETLGGQTRPLVRFKVRSHRATITRRKYALNLDAASNRCAYIIARLRAQCEQSHCRLMPEHRDRRLYRCLYR